jgi:hypothetical protein
MGVLGRQEKICSHFYRCCYWKEVICHLHVRWYCGSSSRGIKSRMSPFHYLNWISVGTRCPRRPNCYHWRNVSSKEFNGYVHLSQLTCLYLIYVCKGTVAWNVVLAKSNPASEEKNQIFLILVKICADLIHFSPRKLWVEATVPQVALKAEMNFISGVVDTGEQIFGCDTGDKS